MKFHAGILTGTPEWDRAGLLVLAHTPGVPIEWIYAAARLGPRRRAKLRDLIHASQEGEFPILGLENAQSVEPGDGWTMLTAVCPYYSGPVPIWSQMFLRADPRSDAEIARVLGVDRKKIWRWRSRSVFDPLTMVRLVPNRGTRITA